MFRRLRRQDVRPGQSVAYRDNTNLGGLRATIQLDPKTGCYFREDEHGDYLVYIHCAYDRWRGDDGIITWVQQDGWENLGNLDAISY